MPEEFRRDPGTGLERVESLTGIRARNRNYVLARIAELRDRDDVPAWFVEETEHVDLWWSAARVERFLDLWASLRFDGDEEDFARFAAWRKQDRHLGFWETDARAHGQRGRREFYRRKAAEWARRYDRVLVTDMDLARLGRKAKPEDGPASDGATQRATKRTAAPSILRSALKSACGSRGTAFEEVRRGKKTTPVCHACGALTEFDRRTLRHRCLECATEWDQDENHCRVILATASGPDSRAAPSPLAPTENGPPVDGMSARQRRFRKNRSQTVVQDGERP